MIDGFVPFEAASDGNGLLGEGFENAAYDFGGRSRDGISQS